MVIQVTSSSSRVLWLGISRNPTASFFWLSHARVSRQAGVLSPMHSPQTTLTADFENQGAHQLAKQFDPEGKRTIGKSLSFSSPVRHPLNEPFVFVYRCLDKTWPHSYRWGTELAWIHPERKGTTPKQLVLCKTAIVKWPQAKLDLDASETKRSGIFLWYKSLERARNCLCSIPQNREPRHKVKSSVIRPDWKEVCHLTRYEYLCPESEIEDKASRNTARSRGHDSKNLPTNWALAETSTTECSKRGRKTYQGFWRRHSTTYRGRPI